MNTKIEKKKFPGLNKSNQVWDLAEILHEEETKAAKTEARDFEKCTPVESRKQKAETTVTTNRWAF